MDQGSPTSMDELLLEPQGEELTTASLSDVLTSRSSFLDELELWALCRECCLTLEYVNSNVELFQTMYISPDTVAFDTEGNVCFLDLDTDPDPMFLAPEIVGNVGNSYESHLFSLGMTLLAATEYNTRSTEPGAQLSDTFTDLLASLTNETMDHRPDLYTVLDACDKALGDQQSQEICFRIIGLQPHEGNESKDSLASYTSSNGSHKEITPFPRQNHSLKDVNDNCLHKTASHFNGVQAHEQSNSLDRNQKSDQVSSLECQQEMTLAEILNNLDRYLHEAEVWAVCFECVLFLQRKIKHLPAYISLDTLVLLDSARVKLRHVTEEKLLEMIYMAPELQQRGTVNEKTCLYGLGKTLQAAIGHKYTSAVEDSEALDILIQALTQSAPDKRPDLAIAFEMCQEYEKCNKIQFRNILVSLFKEAGNHQSRNSTPETTGSNKVQCKDGKFSQFAETVSEVSSATLASNTSGVGVQSAFKPISQGKPGQYRDGPTSMPPAFSSPATHFKPIVIEHSSSSSLTTVDRSGQSSSKDATVVAKLKELKDSMLKQQKLHAGHSAVDRVKVASDGSSQTSNTGSAQNNANNVPPSKAESHVDQNPSTDLLVSAIAQYLRTHLTRDLTNDSHNNGTPLRSVQADTLYKGNVGAEVSSYPGNYYHHQHQADPFVMSQLPNSAGTTVQPVSQTTHSVSYAAPEAYISPENSGRFTQADVQGSLIQSASSYGTASRYPNPYSGTVPSSHSHIPALSFYQDHSVPMITPHALPYHLSGGHQQPSYAQRYNLPMAAPFFSHPDHHVLGDPQYAATFDQQRSKTSLGQGQYSGGATTWYGSLNRHYPHHQGDIRGDTTEQRLQEVDYARDQNLSSPESASPSLSKDSGISVMQQADRSRGSRRQSPLFHVLQIIRDYFTADGGLETGVEDINLAEYIMSLCSLRWDTFCSAVTEKYSHLDWNQNLLRRLYTVVSGPVGHLAQHKQHVTVQAQLAVQQGSAPAKPQRETSGPSPTPRLKNVATSGPPTGQTGHLNEKSGHPYSSSVVYVSTDGKTAGHRVDEMSPMFQESDQNNGHFTPYVKTSPPNTQHSLSQTLIQDKVIRNGSSVGNQVSLSSDPRQELMAETNWSKPANPHQPPRLHPGSFNCVPTSKVQTVAAPSGTNFLSPLAKHDHHHPQPQDMLSRSHPAALHPNTFRRPTNRILRAPSAPVPTHLHQDEEYGAEADSNMSAEMRKLSAELFKNRLTTNLPDREIASGAKTATNRQQPDMVKTHVSQTLTEPKNNHIKCNEAARDGPSHITMSGKDDSIRKLGEAGSGYMNQHESDLLKTKCPEPVNTLANGYFKPDNGSGKTEVIRSRTPLPKFSSSNAHPINGKAEATSVTDRVGAGYHRSLSAVYNRQPMEAGVKVVEKAPSAAPQHHRTSSMGSLERLDAHCPLLGHIGKSQVVYHYATIQHSFTPEVTHFINSIDEENKSAIELRLGNIRQEILVLQRERKKSQKFYRKLSDNASSFKATKGDQHVSEQTLKELSDVNKKLSFLMLCQTHLQMLLAELNGLDTCYLYSLSSSEGSLVFQSVTENPYLQFRTLTTPDSSQMTILYAGTPRGLMSYLFKSSALSNGYIHQFLLCFRYFITSDQLLSFLLDKCRASQSSKQRDAKLGRVQRRSLDLLHYWLEGFYSLDFAPDTKMAAKLVEFLKQQMEEKVEGADNLFSLFSRCKMGEHPELMLTSQLQEEWEEDAHGGGGGEGVYFMRLSSAMRSKDDWLLEWNSFRSLLKSSPPGRGGLLRGRTKSELKLNVCVEGQRSQQKFTNVNDCPAHILAEQLTLMEQEFFRKCHPVHFLNSQQQGVGVALSMPGLRTPSMSRKVETTSSTKKGLFVGEPVIPSSLVDMITHSHELAHWVSIEVLSCGSHKSQVSLVTKLLTVAQMCLNIRNFATALSIADGLENLVVKQLPVWKDVSAKYIGYMNELTTTKMKLKSETTWLLSEKDWHLQPTIPCVLYVALQIQQLEFGSFTLANGMYKWEKMREISEAVDQLRIFRDHEYGFRPDEELQLSLRRALMELSDKDLHVVASTQENNFRRPSSSTTLSGTLRRMKEKFQSLTK